MSSTETQVTIRRAPKIPVFLVLGALVGLLGTLIVTALQPADPAIGFAALFGYFCVYGVPFGVVIGGVIAVLFDRASTRRAKTLPAERTTVENAALENAALDEQGRAELS
ncbi:hypothetical protein [Parafrigoribacterium soli]|uniref:hypothetical protein n=1 Tax=Parafrigoribacterium soli TaxID=3144663 RepID=UPI0032EEE60D